MFSGAAGFETLEGASAGSGACILRHPPLEASPNTTPVGLLGTDGWGPQGTRAQRESERAASSQLNRTLATRPPREPGSPIPRPRGGRQ